MALVGIELETPVSESDGLTTRPPPCTLYFRLLPLLIHYYKLPSANPSDFFTDTKQNCSEFAFLLSSNKQSSCSFTRTLRRKGVRHKDDMGRYETC